MRTNIVATYQSGVNVNKTMIFNIRSVVTAPPSEYIEANAPPSVGVDAPEVEIPPS